MNRWKTSVIRLWGRVGAWAWLLLIAGLNIYIARTLFAADFTPYMGSIESSYMVIARWASAHWGDLSWFPLWFSGTPLFQVYQPVFHLKVAALSTMFGWTIPHAFHFLEAAAYCLGPVTLFWLCWRATGRRAFAACAGAAYSLISPACFLVPVIRIDAGGLLHARRYQVLLSYGEGPHIAAMAVLPFALWAIDGAVSRRRWPFIPLAAVMMASCALTNWPGTFALFLALIAYVLSKRGSQRGIHWPTLFGLGVLSYLLVCPWITPHTLMLVIRNAFQSDNTNAGFALSAPWALIAVIIGALETVFHRARAGSWARFFTYFAVITGVISLGAEAFDWRAMPQAKRFQLEFEMAAVTALAYGACALLRRSPLAVRIAAACCFVAFGVAQTKTYRRQVKLTTTRFDITSTIEYKMAKWFDAHMEGRRVFAPGNVSFWMNMFTDTPQMQGCCEQGTPVELYRLANYQIYSGEGSGDRNAEITMLWLRAYGVDAVGISGPKSTEAYRPFHTPYRFEGVLPAAWRDGDNMIYEMPWKNKGLAHVVDRSALAMKAPESGIDTAPLERLARSLDAEASPSTFRWASPREATIESNPGAGQVVFAQVTYDRNWRAYANGAELKVIPDDLGLMAIDPGRAGPTQIRLVFDARMSRLWTHLWQFYAILLLGMWTIGVRRRQLAAG